MSPPRKPTALHALQGTGRPDRLNADEPKYPVEAPSKPAGVEANAVASAEWDRIVPIMADARVISPAHRGALEAYCYAYAAMLAAQTDPDAKPHTRRDTRADFRQWTNVLGLNPTSSAKTFAAPKVADNPLAALQRRAAARPTAV